MEAGAHASLEPRVRRGIDQSLRKRVRLRKPEPVIVAECKGHVGALEMLERRNDVEHREFQDAVRLVEHQAMGHARAPVVPGQQEAMMAKVVHHVLSRLVVGLRPVPHGPPFPARIALTRVRDGSKLAAVGMKELAPCMISSINSLVQAAKVKVCGYRTIRNLEAITYLLASKLNLRLPK